MTDAASKAADLFVKSYYKYYDTQRHNLHIMYTDAAAIVWNGNPFPGIAAFNEQLLKMPGSQHDINNYDCQPLVNETGVNNLIVTVTGLLKFGEAQHRPFSQTFVLLATVAPDTGKKTYKVAADTFRFV
ncbi:hypothetical protein DFJ73DRAFT_793957 [Zopfochytrium polystomum]|nr:hypothetical protein DFJ73DRAFT_793957 [Zopfochytrium polystomum]